MFDAMGLSKQNLKDPSSTGKQYQQCMGASWSSLSANNPNSYSCDDMQTNMVIFSKGKGVRIIHYGGVVCAM